MVSKKALVEAGWVAKTNGSLEKDGRVIFMADGNWYERKVLESSGAKTVYRTVLFDAAAELKKKAKRAAKAVAEDAAKEAPKDAEGNKESE